MQIREFTASDLEAVYHLLAANGWSHRIPDEAYLAKLIAASQHAWVAVVDEEITGFARALTDGLSNGYLSMVVVGTPFRGRGIGRALVEHIVGAEDNVTWVLRAGREGAPAFFAKLGFMPSTLAMERPRRAAY
ncbi:ribosomal protein S18 acetylase RimI-like enzyme [Variovorax boronicumulans]|uniref:GNAT family N-acetyltransferase n=1 Tax=Variovorax boronicumulans TaxID=436515 RepID=UPI0027898FD2|nr:GNAT family N-acetyltransferase [Variovorax boronicumulans]MDQ0037999.1 ribosomal protein S18 acetylase RimI-like enzyme [Variovorax boronicumulans]